MITELGVVLRPRFGFVKLRARLIATCDLLGYFLLLPLCRRDEPERGIPVHKFCDTHRHGANARKSAKRSQGEIARAALYPLVSSCVLKYSTNCA